jgi:hypothetical protein
MTKKTRKIIFWILAIVTVGVTIDTIMRLSALSSVGDEESVPRFFIVNSLIYSACLFVYLILLFSPKPEK